MLCIAYCSAGQSFWGFQRTASSCQRQCSRKLVGIVSPAPGNEQVIDTILFLLDNGAKIDAGDLNNDSALHLAACMASVEAAKLLLRAGAPVNARNSSGDTPLHKAAGRGDVTIIKILLENGGTPVSHQLNGKNATSLAHWRQRQWLGANRRSRSLSSRHFVIRIVYDASGLGCRRCGTIIIKL